MKKMTQKELAEKLGVKHNTISTWENGANSIDVEILFNICEILEITINDIYGKFSLSKSNNLSFKEIEHIKKYRVLDERGQQTVDTILNSQYEIAMANIETSALDMVAESVSPYGVSRQEAHRIVDQEFDAAEKGKTPEASSFTESSKAKKIG